MFQARLEKIRTEVDPDEICPVIPFPSRDPRRGDGLIEEYHQLLFDDYRVEPANIIYASEYNPFEAYRQLFGAIDRYRDALRELGGCKVYVSPLSSKLLSVGALLACYDHRAQAAGQDPVNVGIPYVESATYGEPADPAASPLTLYSLWIRGNGNMTRVDLMLKPATASPTCIGVGFVVADIVEGSVEQFVAAGGSCGNVMAILAWFGWNAAPVSRLGPDRAAKVVRKDLSEIGVNLANLTSEKSIQTPIVIQRFVKDKAGRQTHRFSLTCPECGNRLPRYRALTLGQADSVIAKSGTPKTFYFDRVSPAALKLTQWAKEQGALVVFEPSSIGDERQFRKAVDVCHLLKYSHDRLGHLRDLGEAHSPRIIGETLAEEGLRVRWRGHWSELAAFQAPWFRDGAGSGDWCTAGLIHRLGSKGAAIFDTLQKPALLAALRFGQALAAVNCGYEGGRGAMLALTRDKLAVALTKLATCKPDFDPVGAEPSGIESAVPKKSARLARRRRRISLKPRRKSTHDAWRGSRRGVPAAIVASFEAVSPNLPCKQSTIRPLFQRHKAFDHEA